MILLYYLILFYFILYLVQNKDPLKKRKDFFADSLN